MAALHSVQSCRKTIFDLLHTADAEFLVHGRSLLLYQGGICIKMSVAAIQIVSGGTGSSESVDLSDECLSGEIKHLL